MENKLKKLFEYQKFEQNERLAKLIAQTEARQATEISDDDLEMVAAAGEINGSGKAAGNDTPAECYGIDHKNSTPFE